MNIILSDFAFIRVAAAVPEIKVADIEFNVNEIVNVIDAAIFSKCNVLLFPELCVTGYTCGDLFYQENLRDASIDALLYLQEYLRNKKITIIIGAPIAVKGKLFNTAVVIDNNGIAGIVPKIHIPGTLQYYEERWFSSAIDADTDSVVIGDRMIPFGTNLLFSNSRTGLMFGIEICEDLWTVKPPSSDMAIAGANVIFNPTASDEYLGKKEYRRNLIASQSGRCLSAYVYASSGPNESTSDLVFSGHSLIAENSIILAENERFNFNSQIIAADIDLQRLNNERIRNNSFGSSYSDIQYRVIPIDFTDSKVTELLRPIHKTPFIPADIDLRKETCQEIFRIQTTALAKRIRHIGISNIVLGISGGLDSTLALLVCLSTIKKLGLSAKNIHAITMPGYGTSEQTLNQAVELAKKLKVTLKTISIKSALEQHFKDIEYPNDKFDITFENAQARERTQILMDYANKVNGIVVGTGDLSEIALGWTTYNGDHMSMYGINSGVPKTLIKYIIDWCASDLYSGSVSELLQRVINTPISPELLPPDKSGMIQDTEKVIGPYILHDFFLYHFIRHSCPPRKIYLLACLAFKNEFKATEIKKYLKVFYSRFFANQFKRNAMPDGIKIGSVSLSPRGDWRMPSDAVANLWLNEIDDL